MQVDYFGTLYATHRAAHHMSKVRQGLIFHSLFLSLFLFFVFFFTTFIFLIFRFLCCLFFLFFILLFFYCFLILKRYHLHFLHFIQLGHCRIFELLSRKVQSHLHSFFIYLLSTFFISISLLLIIIKKVGSERIGRSIKVRIGPL